MQVPCSTPLRFGCGNILVMSENLTTPSIEMPKIPHQFFGVCHIVGVCKSNPATAGNIGNICVQNIPTLSKRLCNIRQILRTVFEMLKLK